MLIKLTILIIIIIVLFSLFTNHPYRIVNKAKSNNYYFNFFKTEVHYIPMGNWFELGDNKIDQVNIKTTEILGSNFLKDQSNVYFKSVRIKNADPGSFAMLNSSTFFARDKNRIYCGTNSFKDLDIASFKFAGTDFGAVVTDKDHVYLVYPTADDAMKNIEIPYIEHISAAKYQMLDDFYGKDDQSAYYKGKPITGSDVNSFALTGEYAKDRHHVYYAGLPVDNIDPISFRQIAGGGYSKDNNAVYFGLNSVDDADGHPKQFLGRVVTGADPETFTIVSGEKIDYAKDKSGYYWGGEPQSPH